MGFGWLFIGYFIAMFMSINLAGSIIRVVGYAVILFSAFKLSKYNRTFDYLKIGTAIMIIVSVLLAISDISGFLYEEMFTQRDIFSSSFDSVMGIVSLGAVLLFNASMLYPIRAIAKETEVDKIAVNAVRNFIFICVYFVLSIIAYLPFDFAVEYASVFSLPVLLLYFLWIILNLILIYSCYARICDENDVEMVRKLSKFAFINKLRAKQDEKEQNLAQRDAEYFKQKKEKKERRRNLHK